uniref:Transmembrane protein 255B n=1 Tax=Denticeps clupeoides TaxID=299321 RepID=A0AAY4CDN9_9TELE
MQPPQHQQPPVPPVQPPDSPGKEPYVKRRRTVLWCTIGLLALSVVILVVGLVSSTRTSNVPVAGFYPGIILSFGSFLGIVGINLVENRRPMLVAAIIFISLGVKACFFCAIVDGVIAADFIDWRPLMEGRCSYFVSGSGYGYDNYYTEVTCQSYNSNCNVRMKSNTCYCCDLYNCERPDYHEHYYQFTGVAGCWDVIHLHRLLWSCVVLNIIGLFLGIINAALLGAFKDLVQSDINQNPAVPQVPLSPSPHMLSYSGFCPSGQTLPAYPNYPLPMQVNARHEYTCTEAQSGQWWPSPVIRRLPVRIPFHHTLLPGGLSWMPTAHLG